LLPDLAGVDSAADQVAIACRKAGIYPEESVELYGLRSSVTLKIADIDAAIHNRPDAAGVLLQKHCEQNIQCAAKVCKKNARVLYNNQQ
jgi:hypothetical protein